MIYRTVFALIFLCLSVMSSHATEAAWARLVNGGYTVLIRHATAPGTGDPPNFDIEDCSTQRNLSDRGRQQAFIIGTRFEARAVPIDRVLSSQYCRSLDTARYAFRDVPIEEFPPLNSFYADPSREAEQTAAVLERIRNHHGYGNLVMVTHQVNITALTGIVPRQGEIIIVAPSGEGIRIAGRLIID